MYKQRYNLFYYRISIIKTTVNLNALFHKKKCIQFRQNLLVEMLQVIKNNPIVCSKKTLLNYFQMEGIYLENFILGCNIN